MTTKRSIEQELETELEWLRAMENKEWHHADDGTLEWDMYNKCSQECGKLHALLTAQLPLPMA